MPSVPAADTETMAYVGNSHVVNCRMWRRSSRNQFLSFKVLKLDARLWWKKTSYSVKVMIRRHVQEAQNTRQAASIQEYDALSIINKYCEYTKRPKPFTFNISRACYISFDGRRHAFARVFHLCAEFSRFKLLAAHPFLAD